MDELKVIKRSRAKDLLFGVIDGISGAPSAAWLALLYIFIDRVREQTMPAMDKLSRFTLREVGILGLAVFFGMALNLRIFSSNKPKEGKVGFFTRLYVKSLVLTCCILAYLQVSGGLYSNFPIAFAGVLYVIMSCFGVIVSTLVILTFLGFVLLIAMNGFKRGKRA